MPRAWPYPAVCCSSVVESAWKPSISRSPRRPKRLGSYRGGKLFPTTLKLLDGRARRDNGHDLVYRDGYLYVTAQNDNQLGILKINDRRILELAKHAD